MWVVGRRRRSSSLFKDSSFGHQRRRKIAIATASPASAPAPAASLFSSVVHLTGEAVAVAVAVDDGHQF